MTEIRGPRIDHDATGEPFLAWEVDVSGFMWEYKGRSLTRWELLMWRVFRRVPKVESPEQTA